ncbi:MAG: tRNA lysidine(34) synthetase TilS [Bacteroidales bacterium]|nr:tRNA lysidine(34) synthetase TilS [Bacteroidales bacterium]
MQERFKEKFLFLTGADSAQNTQKYPGVLVAVSGGIDSMSMANLILKCQYPNFAVATVNFNLRGEESDRDEALVRNWAGKNNIKFYSKSFDTEGYATSKGISIQMAARELRYGWFYEIMDKEGFDCLAIAHNLNDTVETLFINILRGTGVDGLAAIREVVEIPLKGKKIIRPLLGFTRKEIEEYAAKEEVKYYHDHTNFENHYSRNKIRNLIFPLVEEINSSFLHTAEKSIRHFTTAGNILRDLYLQMREKIVVPESTPEKTEFLLEPLLSEKYPEYWLFMLLEEYGFNSDQVRQVSASLNGNPGKLFYSSTHRVLKDRDKLIITPITLPENAGLITTSIPLPENAGDHLTISDIVEISVYEKTAQFTPAPSNKIFFMDADKIEFPLSVRKWKDGDKFRPLGMFGNKKVSDYLTDVKRDMFTKENRYVLISAKGQILCLLGERIDDRFKISASTARILEAHLLR